MSSESRKIPFTHKTIGTPDGTTNAGNHPTPAGGNYTLTNLIVICVIGLVVKLCFAESISTDGETGPASSTIWGYGITAISVFFITFINYALSTKAGYSNDGKDSSIKFAGHFIHSSLPSIFTLILLIYLIYLNFTYFTKINSGKVADEFYDMSRMSTILLYFQIFTLFKYLYTAHKPEKDGKVNDSSNDGAIIYLLSLMNIVFIIILNIILEYFSTDG
jgi:hypothetical protein